MEKKLITLSKEDKEYLEKKAKEKSMTATQLIRLIIEQYRKKEEN